METMFVEFHFGTLLEPVLNNIIYQSSAAAHQISFWNLMIVILVVNQ